MNELYHYGVKGMKWGVRRYQYVDGTYTPAGKKRYDINRNTSSVKRTASLASMKVSELKNNVKTQVTGKQYADTYLAKGTTFSRIQTSKDFENFAFYATYEKKDIDKYMGLFGKNLIRRLAAEARKAEKKAADTGSEEDLLNAKSLRDKHENLKVYQLKITSTNKLRVPSDENAAHITGNLLKEPDFKKNVIASIEDSKAKMRRPTQQVLFEQAQNALRNDPGRMTKSDKLAIYKALNLSLVNHNPQEIEAQNRFYTELKKKGYNALLDLNDREYSSYHAKRPMIVFDTDSVKLQAVSEANPKVVDQLYKKYNRERIRKEIGANTLGYVTKFGNKTLSECRSYTKRKFDSYTR